MISVSSSSALAWSIHLILAVSTSNKKIRNSYWSMLIFGLNERLLGLTFLGFIEDFLTALAFHRTHTGYACMIWVVSVFQRIHTAGMYACAEGLVRFIPKCIEIYWKNPNPKKISFDSCCWILYNSHVIR
jgi:hypothetical protein